jgi:phasin family protein
MTTAKKPAASKANPFAFDASKMFEQFDPKKFMGDFDQKKFMGDFTKAFSAYKIPGVDSNIIMESQKKNLEALAQANKVAFEGAQAVFKRQAEIMKQAMEEMQSVFKDISVAGEPQDKVAKQTDLVKDGVEKALANMRELAEMSGKSNTEAFEMIQSRFTESLEEVKAQVLKLKK